MRKELSHLTMSARSRTAAGPRERGWSRAVPGVFCERPFTNKPVHSLSLSCQVFVLWEMFFLCR